MRRRKESKAWSKEYKGGKSVREVARRALVSRDAVRRNIAEITEMRPRGGGTNNGSIRVGDWRQPGAALKRMSIGDRARSLHNIEASAIEVLRLLVNVGREKALYVSDILERLPALDWHKVDKARRSLELRLFVTSEHVIAPNVKGGKRRAIKITDDGIEAAAVLGVCSTRDVVRRIGRPVAPPNARGANRGEFSANDGRLRVVPLSSMSFDERVASLDDLTTPVREVLTVLCAAGGGTKFFTSTIRKEMPGRDWQDVDNACKALAKRGFVTRVVVDTPTGQKKTATEITGDGMRAARDLQLVNSEQPKSITAVSTSLAPETRYEATHTRCERVLIALLIHSQATYLDLQKATGLSDSVVRKNVRYLVARGFVSRGLDEYDTRLYRHTLTPKKGVREAELARGRPTLDPQDVFRRHVVDGEPVDSIAGYTFIRKSVRRLIAQGGRDVPRSRRKASPITDSQAELWKLLYEKRGWTKSEIRDSAGYSYPDVEAALARVQTHVRNPGQSGR